MIKRTFHDIKKVDVDYRKKKKNHPGVLMKKIVSLFLNILAIQFCIASSSFAQEKTPPSTPTKKIIPTSPKTPPVSTVFNTKITPQGNREVIDNLNVARPTKLFSVPKGGKITLDVSAKKAIKAYLTNYSKTSILSMDPRVITALNEELIQTVERERSLGATPQTPEQKKIGHALSEEMILQIFRSVRAEVFKDISQNRLSIMIPSKISHNNITNTSSLNSGLNAINLCFGRDDLGSFSYLFHACRQALSNGQISLLSSLTPVNVTLKFDNKAGFLYFEQSKEKRADE